MPTIQSSIEVALFSRVASLTLSPALPVAWPNVSYDPPLTGYIRVTHIPNIARRLFLGSSDPHQRMGLLQVDVFTPLNKGASAATEIAGKVAEHFACDLKMVSGDVTVRVSKAPDVNQAIADDAYWFVPTTVTYEAYA
jgi:hypothetical protein